MDTDIQDQIEEAEPVDAGLSNHIYFADDEVIKVFKRYPFTSFYTSMLEPLQFRFQYIDRDTRIRNEVEMKEEIRETGLHAPEVTYTGEKAIKYRKCEGQTGYEYLNDCSEDEARAIAEELDTALKELHARDIAIKDCRITNFIIEDDGDIWSIDHEYASLTSGELFKGIDYFQLVNSVRQTETYDAFMEEVDIHPAWIVLSLFVLLPHALLLEKSLDRAVTGIANIKYDLVSLFGLRPY